MADNVTPDDNDQAIPAPAPVAAVQTRTADADWTTIENDPDFRTLVREKRNFILPLTIIFIVYYFGFLILVGYFPDVVETKVFGNINIAYLFALSQFILAWILVYLYTRRAKTFDRLAQNIVNKVKGEQV